MLINYLREVKINYFSHKGLKEVMSRKWMISFRNGDVSQVRRV